MAVHRVSCWTIFGTILIGLSVCFIILASALPYWQESRSNRQSGVLNLGLWTICFSDAGYAASVFANDELLKRYYGCNYVFDRDLRTILSWIYPDWFILVSFLVTLGLLIQPVAFIINILYYVKVCSPHLEYVLVGVSSLMNIVNGFCTAIAIMVFGIKSDTDKYWMPQPESNHLSYAFGLCAVVPVLCWLASMCHGIEFLRLKSIRDRNARAKIYSRGEFARY